MAIWTVRGKDKRGYDCRRVVKAQVADEAVKLSGLLFARATPGGPALNPWPFVVGGCASWLALGMLGSARMNQSYFPATLAGMVGFWIGIAAFGTVIGLLAKWVVELVIRAKGR